MFDGVELGQQIKPSTLQQTCPFLHSGEGHAGRSVTSPCKRGRLHFIKYQRRTKYSTGVRPTYPSGRAQPVSSAEERDAEKFLTRMGAATLCDHGKRTGDQENDQTGNRLWKHMCTAVNPIIYVDFVAALRQERRFVYPTC